MNNYNYASFNLVVFIIMCIFRVFLKGRKEVVFLLCGSDESVHMFCEVGRLVKINLTVS